MFPSTALRAVLAPVDFSASLLPPRWCALLCILSSDRTLIMEFAAGCTEVAVPHSFPGEGCTPCQHFDSSLGTAPYLPGFKRCLVRRPVCFSACFFPVSTWLWLPPAVVAITSANEQSQRPTSRAEGAGEQHLCCKFRSDFAVMSCTITTGEADTLPQFLARSCFGLRASLASYRCLMPGRSSSHST